MRICGIVAEYNPFHNGHAYQIEQTRALTAATHIVAVISPYFVQRGDIAVFDKWTRTQTALQNGVDLVLELPTVFALSSANRFAQAGVWVLDQVGIDLLSFGSECGSITDLAALRAQCQQAAQSQDFTRFLKQGVSFPRARALAVQALFGENQTLDFANNLLGVEYLNAIECVNPAIQPFTIPRIGMEHDQMTAPTAAFASASFLRAQLKQNKPIDAFVPPNARSSPPVFAGDVEQALLYRLRTMSCADFAALPDVSEGLENRLYRAAQSAPTVDAFWTQVKTKRYTHARLRRLTWCAALHITADLQSLPIPCVRVLGANQKGFEILARARRRSTVPLSGKMADLLKSDNGILAAEVRAQQLYALALPSAPDEIRHGAFFFESPLDK